MKWPNLSRSWTHANEQNRLLKYSNLILGISLMIAVFGILDKEREIVLVPPKFSEEITLTQDKASSGYKNSWSVYVAGLVGNIHPGNADFIAEQLSSLLDARLYHQFRGQLASEVSEIMERRISVSYKPREVRDDPESGKTFVVGDREVVVPGAEPTRDESFVYEFTWEIRGRVPLLTHFDYYKGAPRTADYMRRYGDKVKKEEATRNNGKGGN